MKAEDICSRLRANLKEAVGRNAADALLLSAGLDSSILASLSPGITAITVGFEGSQAPDIGYAKELASILGIEHRIRSFTAEEAFRSLPEVMEILTTFDPALPNDIAIYSALKVAQEWGMRSVMTGDGADELFAGYSYMWHLKPPALNDYIRHLDKTMVFSSNRLGEYLGIEIKQPYLDEEVRRLALEIEPELKLGIREGHTYGKWILRQAFEGLLPRRIVWRDKLAIEYGSGINEFRRLVASKVSDDELREKSQRYGVKFLPGAEKEHLFYYEVYRDVIGEIPPPKPGESPCPACGAGIPSGLHHCGTCGFSTLT